MDTRFSTDGGEDTAASVSERAGAKRVFAQQSAGTALVQPLTVGGWMAAYQGQKILCVG